MKFTAREDIEAPIGEVFDLLSDYAWFERAAMRRGAEVTRSEGRAGPVWNAAFTYRGKLRRVEILQDQIEPPTTLRFTLSARSVEGDLSVDLVELGRRRTRISVATEVRPRTLAARLFIQSLRLARGRVTQRYQSRIAQFARLIEDRLRNPGVVG